MIQRLTHQWLSFACILANIRYGAKWRAEANHRYGLDVPEDDAEAESVNEKIKRGSSAITEQGIDDSTTATGEKQPGSAAASTASDNTLVTSPSDLEKGQAMGARQQAINSNTADDMGKERGRRESHHSETEDLPPLMSASAGSKRLGGAPKPKRSGSLIGGAGAGSSPSTSTSTGYHGSGGPLGLALSRTATRTSLPPVSEVLKRTVSLSGASVHGGG